MNELLQKNDTPPYQRGQASHQDHTTRSWESQEDGPPLLWFPSSQRDTITAMKHSLLILPVVLMACGGGDSASSFACGIQAIAGPVMVLEQLRVAGRILTQVPDGVEGIVPARAVGYPSAHALAALGPDGAVLGFEGEGFPNAPGFGLILVEDSLETFRGVLVFETEAPRGLPMLGSISSTTMTLPLYGLRVTWSAVSDPRCPLLSPVDTVPQ